MKSRGWMVCGVTILVLAGPAGAEDILNGYTGPVLFELDGWDNGTVYPAYPAGTVLGVSNNPLAGVTGMDGLAGRVLPVGGLTGAPGTWAPWAIGTDEDTWGIGQLTRVIGESGSTELWNNATSTTELTAIFYGSEDYYLEQTSQNWQRINGVGMHIDI
jgi:hypothetical protein